MNAPRLPIDPITPCRVREPQAGMLRTSVNIAQAVRSQRRQLDWTQARLAREAGLSAGAVGRVEGGAPVRTRTLLKLNVAFELNAPDVGWTADRETHGALTACIVRAIGDGPSEEVPLACASQPGIAALPPVELPPDVLAFAQTWSTLREPLRSALRDAIERIVSLQRDRH